MRTEPFTFNGFTAAQFKALLDKYHLEAPSRHGDVSITRFATTLADSKTLRQKYVGSGGFPTPGIGSYESTLATAIVMNELGRRSVRNGTGKFYVHNHQGEFRTKYVDPDTGETKSAWQILVENTDPRYVTFQLDVLWAADGGADPVDLTSRIRPSAIPPSIRSRPPKAGFAYLRPASPLLSCKRASPLGCLRRSPGTSTGRRLVQSGAR